MVSVQDHEREFITVPPAGTKIDLRHLVARSDQIARLARVGLEQLKPSYSASVNDSRDRTPRGKVRGYATS